MSHTHHPHIAEAGLADGCPDCDRAANDPFSHLDMETIGAMWLYMIQVELSPAFSGPSYRSANDAKAGKRMYEFYVFIERVLPRVDARVWPPEVREPIAFGS